MSFVRDLKSPRYITTLVFVGVVLSTLSFVARPVFADPALSAPSGQAVPGAVTNPPTPGAVTNPPVPGAVTNPPAPGAVTNPPGAVLNPLRFPTIQAFFQAILDFLLILALPLIIFMIVYTGFLFVTAQGDTEKLKTARNMFMWTIIGGMIILGATVIAQVIRNTVDNITAFIDLTRFL